MADVMSVSISLEHPVCILIRADLAGKRSNDDLPRAQAGSKVTHVSPRLIDALGRTPGNTIKPCLDPNQMNLLPPAYP